MQSLKLQVNRLFENLANKNKKFVLLLNVAVLTRMVQVDPELKQTTWRSKLDKNYKLFNTFLNKKIRNSVLKETYVHFQIERVKSRSKNSETFGTAVILKSLIKNGASIKGLILVEKKSMEEVQKENQEDQSFFLQ